MNKHFRTKLDKTLEEHLSQFEHWNEIQSEEVDLAFEVYLRGHYISNKAPKEVSMVFKLIEKGGLLGVETEAHEKWEALEYLKKEYSLEDISNGKAHKEYKPFAHTEARFKEFKLHQFLYENQFGKKSPPMYAFLLVSPFLEIFGEEVHGVEIRDEHLEYLIGEFGKYKDSIMSEKCSKKDLKNALKFFEKNGYLYRDKAKILKRAEEFTKRYT